MGKRTEEQIRADLIAKVAKIDQRAANRKARFASKEVQCLERTRAALRSLAPWAVTATQQTLLADTVTRINEWHARAVAEANK